MCYIALESLKIQDYKRSQNSIVKLSKSISASIISPNWHILKLQKRLKCHEVFFSLYNYKLSRLKICWKQWHLEIVVFVSICSLINATLFKYLELSVNVDLDHSIFKCLITLLFSDLPVSLWSWCLVLLDRIFLYSNSNKLLKECKLVNGCTASGPQIMKQINCKVSILLCPGIT